MTEKDRFEQILEIIESDTGKHRICWTQPNDDRTFRGSWAYIEKEKAEIDAKRFGKMPFCTSAWVESRE